MAKPFSVLKQWEQMKNWPGGKRIFSFLLGRAVPYTGSISPRVLELQAGYAKACIPDKRRLRNHLRSLHAIALTNLAELCASLAISTAQPTSGRWIVTGLDMVYVKKARGTITGECRAQIDDWSQSADVHRELELRDESGDVVARATVHWRVGPIVKAAGAGS